MFGRRRGYALVGMALLTAAVVMVRLAAGPQDGTILVLVHDIDPTEPESQDRRDEPRVDAILLVHAQRTCSQVVVTALPRDLTGVTGGEPISAAMATMGPAAMARRIGRALSIRIAAVSELDFSAVATVTRVLGPITVELPTASRDAQIGFEGGPGLVSLDAVRSIQFLRARSWEEQTDTTWEMVSSSDLARMARTRRYLDRVATAVMAAPPRRRAQLVVELLAGSQTSVLDAASAAGFAVAMTHAQGWSMTTIEVEATRPEEGRRSPFEPAHFGTFSSLSLAPGAHMSRC